MRSSVLAVAVTAVLLPASAFAQAPARAQPPRPAAPQQPAAAATSPLFACRTAEETCFLGIVVGSQVAVVYTNAQNANADAKPVDVTGQDGAKTDLSKDNGRAVMIAGSYDPKSGIKGEVVEVGGPLLSLTIKAQVIGGNAEEAPGPQKAGPRPRR